MSDTEEKMVVDNTLMVNASPESAGSMLRAAREKAGLHVAALAVAIKIPVKKLEALEADQLQGSHDLVFTRALASSVCRALKIDSKPILDALPKTIVRDLHVDDNGINAPFAQGSVVHSKTIDQAVAQPWVVLVLALCVGALVIATSRWWGNQDGGPSSGVSISDEVVTPQAMAPVVIPAPPTPEPKAEAGGGIPAPTSVVEPTVATVPSKPVSAADAQFASSALGVTQRIDLRPVGTTSQPTPGSEVTVSFKARQQPVWVEVVDAKGEVRLRRNVGAGEKVECGGVPPLAVVVGRADSLDMEVRGKPFDFAALAKDNVARFEVK